VTDAEPKEDQEQPGKALQNQQNFHMPTFSVAGIKTRMVGRDAELLMLQNMFLDATEDAEVHVVTILADAGLGKSRLLYEFEKWLEAQPGEISYFKGRASPESQETPFGLMRQIFAHRLDILESDSSTEVREKFRAGMAPTLNTIQADLVGQLIGLDFSHSEAVQAQLGSESFGDLATNYLTKYVQIIASEPTVMFFEDIHWADDSSLDLLDYLVTMIPDTRLLVVCLARPSLFDRRPNWGEGQEIYTRIHLKSLSRRASRELVREILQKATGVPAVLRDLIIEHAEGNPFYVEELIKMLIEDGVIVPGEGQWAIKLEHLAELRIPLTLTGILQTRLDSLPQEEKTVLQRAAVVGRLFWNDVVAELASDRVDTALVDKLLEDMRGRELILQREISLFEETDEYIFKHALLRDVTYQTVLAKLRSLYHVQVAQWLERTAGDRINEHLRLIARHYELAGEKVQAVRFLRLSGEESLRVSAFRDAVRAFEHALSLLPDQAHSGEQLASDPLSKSEILKERAILLVKLGNLYNRLGNFIQGEEFLEQGLILARQTRDSQIEIEALNRLAQVASERGSYQKAQRYLDEVLVLAQELDDQECVASTLSMQSTISWKWGDLEEAEKCCQQSLVIYRDLGNKPRIALLFNILGILATLQENFEQAEQSYEQGLKMARDIDDRQIIADVLNNVGYINHHSLKKLEKAKRYYQESLLIAREIDHRSGATSTLINLGQLYILLGEYEVAWATLQEAITETVAIGAVPLTLDALVGLAKLQLEVGQYEAAAELLGLALNHPALEHDSRQLAEAVLESLRKKSRQSGLSQLLYVGKSWSWKGLLRN
jgi:tetratricopeptide (TPR) repeat protein